MSDVPPPPPPPIKPDAAKLPRAEVTTEVVTELEEPTEPEVPEDG